VLRANGKSDEVVTDHRKLDTHLGGKPTVVGGIVSLGVMAVARLGGKGKKNQHVLPHKWDADLKGDLVLFRVEDDGASAPYTLKEHRKWVKDGMPDSDPEVPSDAEEEIDDGEEMDVADEEESSDDEESSDEEEEDLATFTERMKALPVAELRKACGLFKLSDKGSKLEMIARLHAHAQEQNNMDVGDSQEEDEEEEEEKKKNLPPPKASPKCKKAASPGPVKTIAKTRKAGAKARK
jgi:hypothetical protein